MTRPIPIGWWFVQQVAQVAGIVVLTQLLVRVLDAGSKGSQLLIFGCVVIFVVALSYAVRSGLSKDRVVPARDPGRSAES